MGVYAVENTANGRVYVGSSTEAHGLLKPAGGRCWSVRDVARYRDEFARQMDGPS